MVNNDAKSLSFIEKALEVEHFESFLFMTTVLWRRLLGFLLLEELLVLAVELIDATGAIDEFHLAGVEGM